MAIRGAIVALKAAKAGPADEQSSAVGNGAERWAGSRSYLGLPLYRWGASPRLLFPAPFCFRPIAAYCQARDISGASSYTHRFFLCCGRNLLSLRCEISPCLRLWLQGWQKKLTALHISNFPWEPQPTVPSNVPKAEPSPALASAAANPANGNYGGARIKTESGGYESQGSGYQRNGFSSGLDMNVAQHRAAGLLQQRFGAQAEPVIAGLTQGTGISPPGQGRGNGNAASSLPLPGQGQPQPQADSKQQSTGGYNGQTDGPDDAPESWASVLTAKNLQSDDGPTGRLTADAALCQHIEHKMDQMGGGLMVPLSELSSAKKGKRKITLRPQQPIPNVSGIGPKIPQLDGEYSDDDDVKPKPEPDDEAINSDLDDSEDELAQADDDDAEIGDIMLCTYDKVQRVKNKWKCTLKDGILTTNGKE